MQCNAMQCHAMPCNTMPCTAIPCTAYISSEDSCNAVLSCYFNKQTCVPLLFLCFFPRIRGQSSTLPYISLVPIWKKREKDKEEERKKEKIKERKAEKGGILKLLDRLPHRYVTDRGSTWSLGWRVYMGCTESVNTSSHDPGCAPLCSECFSSLTSALCLYI